MLDEDVRLVSIDDHVIEHATVWSDRLPKKYQEMAPRVVELPPDRQAWIYEGREYPSLGLDASVGRDPSEFRLEARRFADMRDGCYVPAARTADMDDDGVEAQTLFPSFPRFCGQTFHEADDRDLALLCVRAYNDFILEEWAAAHPGRFIPLIIVPLWDPLLAAQEVERTAPLGARGITFCENPSALGLPSFWTDHWDPMFSAAESAGMPLCLHFGSSSKLNQPSPESPFIIPIALGALNSMATTADLLFSPVFVKYPKLQVMLSEGGTGWVPYVLERCDYVVSRHRYFDDIRYDRRPSEVFRENMSVCFITDQVGLDTRHHIGVENMLWESDYPHSDSLWPHSRKVFAESVVDVPAHEVRLIGEDNARRLFNWPRDMKSIAL